MARWRFQKPVNRVRSKRNSGKIRRTSEHVRQARIKSRRTRKKA